MKAYILLILSLCVLSSLAMNYEELTQDVYRKINLLRTNPDQFIRLINRGKYPKFYAKVQQRIRFTAQPL